MFTELRFTTTNLSAERAARAFEVARQYPEAIGVAPNDPATALWGKTAQRRTVGHPEIIEVADLPAGTILLYFVGSDGMLMLLIETLRLGRRDRLTFACTDAPPAWAMQEDASVPEPAAP